MEVFQLVLPAIAIMAFVAFKMPEKMKDQFFKIPTWISGTAISFLLIKPMFHGVMGPYAAILCDLILTPFFSFVKNRREKKQESTPIGVLAPA